MDGPVERVIVVGAGISGLAVANAFTYAGVECVVLEARERIGGRLHTVDLAGMPIDMGGSWIHHPLGNPLLAFADQAQISCRSGDPVPALTGYDCGEGRRLARAEVEASLAMAYDEFPAAVEDLRLELGPLASAAHAIDAFLAGAALSSHESRRARQGLRAVIEAEAAGMSETQSLQWMWNEVEYGGHYFGVLPAGGYRSVVEAMAAGVDVRLGCEVTDVETTASGVRVRTAGGDLEEASHAVVAVPLGVLKRGSPRFTPGLPVHRVASIQRLGFGHFEKVSLRFDEPFWRAAGFSHLMLFPRDPSEATTWVIDEDDFGRGPVVTASSLRATPSMSFARAPTPPRTGFSTCSHWPMVALAPHPRQLRSRRGERIRTQVARTRIFRQVLARRMSICSANRSVGGYFSLGSTPKAHDSPTPMVRW